MSDSTMMNGAMRRMVLLAVLPVVAALTMLGGCSDGVTEDDIKPITLTEFRALLDGKHGDKVMIVDPRAKSDFDAGHIPGAQNFAINDERARSGDGLNPVFKGHKTIVVYGNDPSSATARAMTMRLLEKKADNVRLFWGGLVEWRRAGLKVVSTTEAGAAATDAGKQTGTLAK